MSPRASVTAILIACAALATAQTAKPANSVHHKHAKHSAAKAAPEQPAPAPVQPPPTPEQLPASPPQVMYADGMLTINANNSTLGDILSAVRARTGANIEAPPGPQNERVVAHLGPAPARDVLASLLQGSRFDYILLGSVGNPEGVEHIVLTAKSGSAAAAAPTAAPIPGSATNPPIARRQPPQPAADEAADEDADAQTNAPDENDTDAQGQQLPQQLGPQPGVAQPGMAQPGMVQPGVQPGVQQPGMAQPGFTPNQIPGAVVPGEPIVPNQTQQTPNQQPNPGAPQSAGGQPNPSQPQIKTPQQLLQELQRLQKQQQKQQ